MPTLTLLAALCCYLLALPSQAAITFNSGNEKVPLLELYTSEGCSGCPPADNWLSQFKHRPELWQKVIPIAFHVDYWNYLGWKDPFARQSNSQRQYRYKRHGNIKAVYTPGFVYNGQESRSWYYRRDLPETKELAGNLNLKLDNQTVSASFDTANTKAPLILHIALLGFDLETQVPAGENKGKILKHNFVILEHQQSISTNRMWQTNLPTSTTKSKKTALAAWVTQPDDPTPIQATGGWLPSILSD